MSGYTPIVFLVGMLTASMFIPVVAALARPALSAYAHREGLELPVVRIPLVSRLMA